MRRTIAFVASLSLVALAAGLRSPSAAAAPDGKALFLAQKCNLCHAAPAAGIESKAVSEKMKGPDLVNLDPKLDSAWLAKYLTKQEKKDGKNHQKEFKGTDEELQALIAWVKSQKQ